MRQEVHLSGFQAGGVGIVVTQAVQSPSSSHHVQAYEEEQPSQTAADATHLPALWKEIRQPRLQQPREQLQEVRPRRTRQDNAWQTWKQASGGRRSSGHLIPAMC